jgi:hypothetical protein
LSHAKDSVDLVAVDFWDLVSWHVLHVEVILQEGICHGSSLVGVFKSFGEFSWVFLLKENIDPVKSDLFFGVLPVALISLRLVEVLLDLKWSPEAKSIKILPEALGWDLSFDESLGLLLNGWALVLISVQDLTIQFGGVLVSEDHPLGWCSWIHILVVKGIER